MTEVKIEVLSQFLFDEKMEEMGLNDENVENANMAFISIIGTQECLKYYLDEGNTKHYFKGHPNVLNLDFDDIGEDVMYNGHHFKTMRMEQAEKTVDFIEDMIEKGIDTFEIHCRAGYSRSRAVGEFIYRYCLEHDIEVEYADRNEFTTFVNQGVLRRLSHAYWKKHKLEEYSEEGKEYPDDLVNIPIREINRDEY
jgi:protein-tyrosine phosphatase